MAEFDKNTALIDQYLSGELSAQEQADFEQRLQTDEQLKQELELQQEIKKAVELEGEELLKKELDEYHDEVLTVYKGTLTKPWVKIGLGLLGVVSVGLLVMVMVNVAKKAEELALKHSLTNEQDTITLSEENLPKVMPPISGDTLRQDSARNEQVEELPQHQSTTMVAMEMTMHHYVITTAPSYTLKGTKLQLYNFDHPLRRVDLRIHDNQLYLFHENHYYPLKSGAENKPLVHLEDVRAFETLKYATGAGPKMTITNEQRYALYAEEPITLLVNPDFENNEVLFNVENDQLMVSKALSQKDLQLFRYGQGESMYVLEVDGEKYLLKEQVTHSLEALEEKNVFPIDKVAISVRHETVENSYFLEESN